MRPLWISLLAGQLFAQSAPEPVVGLVVATQGARLLRAGAALPLAARPGDVLFPADSLSGQATFLFCPEKTSQTLSPDGTVQFTAGQLRLRSGRLDARQTLASCFLPIMPRVTLASQQHYGLSMVRPLDSGAAEPELSEPRRSELAVIPGSGPAAFIQRAVLFEKYNRRASAASEYKRALQQWPDAAWILGRLFALEDVPPAARAAPVEPGGRTYALLVGISKYQSAAITPLLYADRDAQLVRDFLASERGGALPDGAVTPLLNEQATTAAIRLAFHEFLKVKTGRNDTAILFIAAHGTVQLSDRQAYLVTYDTDPQDLAGTALPMAEVQRLFREELTAARRVMVYLDACHSGRLGTVKIGAINNAVERLTETEAEVFTFMASGKDEQSEEGPQYGGGHGAFSYFVVDALNGASDRDQNGKVEFNEFVDYVRKMVVDATSSRQNPNPA